MATEKQIGWISWRINTLRALDSTVRQYYPDNFDHGVNRWKQDLEQEAAELSVSDASKIISLLDDDDDYIEGVRKLYDLTSSFNLSL